jgi:hypothetical protein
MSFAGGMTAARGAGTVQRGATGDTTTVTRLRHYCNINVTPLKRHLTPVYDHIMIVAQL